jgi:3-deoxy-manno-octulosonate cytidylyltransferase (CMP-KDO synthetase)
MAEGAHMRVVGVIPARYGSTRFPGKPLAQIAGKPLLQWVVEGARKSVKIHHLLVATDDKRIMQLCETINVEAVLTPSDLPTGTDRIERAVNGRSPPMEADVVVNIQGDEPLINGKVLDALVEPMLKNADLEMATLARKLEAGDLESKNTAKIVVDGWGRALYFSRLPIPFSRTSEAQHEIGLKHIGIYAYRRQFLERFCRQPPVPIELSEGLEQLRALYLGAEIQVVTVEHSSWGVDTPEDVAKVEKMLRERR